MLFFMDSGSKNYELAYLLAPSMTEEAALAQAGKLSVMIEAEHAAIRHLETPKKRKLAYAIKKEKTAYFGWTTFAAAPDTIARSSKKIREMPEVLRHMITEEQIETRKPFIRSFSPRPMSSMPAPKPIPREEQKPDEKLDLEALDKRLEEILGK